MQNNEELKQKLLHVTLELESANKVKMQLLDHLNIVYRERDELREALNIVLHKLPSKSSPPISNVPENNNSNNNMIIPYQVIPENKIMVPTTKANSSITESNSLSHNSSAVDSFLDAVSSPDFSNMNVGDSRNVGLARRDRGSIVIENIIKGKNLPPKGKLLQSVMDAGPLLQNLVVAGPLPSWRNPPPVQPIKVPPFNIKDFDISGFSMNGLDTCSSASMLNFAMNMNNPIPWQSSLAPSFSYQGPASKRQRF